jgi:hypothetical protein
VLLVLAAPRQRRQLPLLDLPAGPRWPRWAANLVAAARRLVSVRHLPLGWRLANRE